MRLTRSPEKTHRSYNDLDKIRAQQKSEAASIQPLKTNEFKRKKIEAVNKSRTNEEGINKGK